MKPPSIRTPRLQEPGSAKTAAPNAPRLMCRTPQPTTGQPSGDDGAAPLAMWPPSLQHDAHAARGSRFFLANVVIDALLLERHKTNSAYATPPWASPRTAAGRVAFPAAAPDAPRAPPASSAHGSPASSAARVGHVSLPPLSAAPLPLASLTLRFPVPLNPPVCGPSGIR